MRSLLVTAFALSADALDFVAVSPGNGAAYEGSLSGNGNSIGYTAANGDQWNAFIYNSSYDQSTIMITPAQAMPTERPKQVRLNYAGNRACYDMKEDATQNVIFAIAQYSSKQLTKITDESGDRKAGYCAISGDCGETECTLAFISDMDLAGDSLEKGKVQVYTTKLIRENALGVPTFAPFTMITKASFDADSSSKVEASGGVNLDYTGEHVVFRAKGSAFSPMASSKGPDAFLHTVADGSTFMINPTLVDCDLDAVQSFLVAQNPDAANLSPTTASCPSVAGQGGVPSAATIGVGATDNPVISGDARFMSYTANYDIADTRGALEAPQAITSPNLFLFDAKLGFTWQLTKEGDLPLKEADIEARCCPGASSSKQRGTCEGTDNELKYLCCWQKPCGSAALNPDISADGNSIALTSDYDLAGDQLAIPKLLDTFTYHIPTSTFTRVTSNTDDTYDTVFPSISGDGSRVVFKSDWDQVQNADISDEPQLFEAALKLGCSKNALATNYVPSDTVDVETCCAFQDEGPDADAPSSTTKLTFAAPIKMSEKRVAVAGGASRWCGVFADDLASDIACALALPSSVVTIQGMEACVASGEIRSFVVVVHALKVPIPGTLGPDAAALKLAEEWGMQGGGATGLGALWKGYVSKLLAPTVPPETCPKCPTGGSRRRRVLFSSTPSRPDFCPPC